MSQTPIYATRQGVISLEVASGPLPSFVDLLDFAELDDDDESQAEAEDTLAGARAVSPGDVDGQLTSGSDTDGTVEWDETIVEWASPAQVPSFQDAYQSYAVFGSSGLAGFPHWKRCFVQELNHARAALDNPAFRCYEPYRPLTEMSFQECVQFGYVGVGPWGQLLGVAFPDGETGLDLTDGGLSTMESQWLNWWHNYRDRIHQAAVALEAEEWAITAPPHVQAQCVKKLEELRASRWEALSNCCVRYRRCDYEEARSQAIQDMEQRDTLQFVVEPIESWTCRRRCQPRVSVVETLVDSSDETLVEATAEPVFSEGLDKSCSWTWDHSRLVEPVQQQPRREVPSFFCDTVGTVLSAISGLLPDFSFSVTLNGYSL
ncbi:hypothetical protein HDU81_000157 [Chytriomyces hyalinus]|nr:hypothetical protein HDU81_000157 [Chytriomyces hyalinus]